MFFLSFLQKESWIQNMTVKENILFGNDFDEEKYEQVLYACALKEVRNDNVTI